jgi:gamma-glutamyltranspeptidase/glutathione hydrolase
MLVRAPNSTYEFIDFRETAPAAAFQDMYKNNVAASLYGGLASGVPGELRGLEHLHTNYGKLPWRDVVMPAVNVARCGFTVTADHVKYFAQAIASAPGQYDFLTYEPTWAIDFAPNGTRLGLGDTMTRKRYADTLETIANHGVGAFYEGPIANATIAALRKANGTMTLQDLKNYTVAIRDPVAINYKGYKVTSCAAPSGGVVVLAALNIFKGYTTGDPSRLNQSVHYLDESMKFAYGMRTQLGDPSFVNNTLRYEADMISDATGNEVRSKISDTKTFGVEYYDPLGLESLETVRFFQFIPFLPYSSFLRPFLRPILRPNIESATARHLAHRRHRQIRHGHLPHHHNQHPFWESRHGPRDRRHHEQRNERLLHPGGQQRVWLCPESGELCCSREEAVE